MERPLPSRDKRKIGSDWRQVFRLRLENASFRCPVSIAPRERVFSVSCFDCASRTRLFGALFRLRLENASFRCPVRRHGDGQDLAERRGRGSVCVCARMRARARALACMCLSVCARLCARTRACVRVRVRVRACACVRSCVGASRRAGGRERAGLRVTVVIVVIGKQTHHSS